MSLESAPVTDPVRSEQRQQPVIPSSTLRAPLPHPSPYGQTLGVLKLLILGSSGIGKTTLANLLLESNDDIVHLTGWQGNILTASTDWVEHKGIAGRVKYEPALNVQITELPGYNPLGDISTVVEPVLDLIHARFKPVHDLLNPGSPPSSTLVNFLSSPSSPFYTALIILTPTSPTRFDTSLVEQLGPHIPIIALPPVPSSRHTSLSSFRPIDSADLKSQLFRSPGMLASIRMEAADRFLRWREVHRVRNLSTLSVGSSVQVGGGFGGGISGGRPLNPFTIVPSDPFAYDPYPSNPLALRSDQLASYAQMMTGGGFGERTHPLNPLAIVPSDLLYDPYPSNPFALHSDQFEMAASYAQTRAAGQRGN